jgi:hypothetical protein
LPAGVGISGPASRKNAKNMTFSDIFGHLPM